MNLNQLELLRILQQTDFNQSQAAQKMNVVQSAVSRQLQLLEAELGSPLFERYGKKLIGLTPLGLQIMDEVDEINQAQKNIHALSDSFKDNRQGALRIATTHTQAKYLLPGPIQRFREKYPHFNIYIIQSNPDKLIQSLHTYEADLAICTEKLTDDESLIVKDGYQWHHVAVVPKGHPLLDQTISLSKLTEYPVLTYIPGFGGRSTIDKAFQKGRQNLNITLSAADSDIIKTYVRLGLGVGIIASMAFDEMADSDLVSIDLSHLMPRSVTKIAYLKELYMPGYLNHFISELIAESSVLNT